MNQVTEQELADKAVAPRVTADDVQANIIAEYYINAGDAISNVGYIVNETDRAMQSVNLLTFCVLVLKNGFTVTGESACASPENYDAEIGRKLARAAAVSKIWPLMGYELRSKLQRRLEQGASA